MSTSVLYLNFQTEVGTFKEKPGKLQNMQFLSFILNVPRQIKLLKMSGSNTQKHTLAPQDQILITFANLFFDKSVGHFGGLPTLLLLHV